MKTENSDRDWFYSNPPCPWKCPEILCDQLRSFHNIYFDKLTYKNWKRYQSESKSTHRYRLHRKCDNYLVECRSLVPLLVPASPSRRVALFKFLLSVNKIIKCTCNELDKANKYWIVTSCVANTKRPNNQVMPRRGKRTTSDLIVDLKQ